MLAADPHVPRRDALLRVETMAGVLSQRLHAGVPVDACERTYVKYRIGESVRVVYRYRVGDHTTFAAARSGRRDGVFAPELDAALYPFPQDRKLPALPMLACTGCRLIAWAAEQSATAEILDGIGGVVAYAKVERDDGERRGLTALADQDAVRVPNVLAAGDGVLILEALAGRRLDRLDGPDLVHGLRAFGEALAALHTVRTAARQPSFARLTPARLATAVDIIARARPDAARAARQLLDRLGEPPEQPEVTVHGDANLRNALFSNRGVALVDLEHLATGPAVADLGQVLAHLLVSRAPRAAVVAFLDGYGEHDRHALRWYTAASVLARIALPAISRVRDQQLAELPRLLAAGTSLITPVTA